MPARQLGLLEWRRNVCTLGGERQCYLRTALLLTRVGLDATYERWGAGVETQKNIREEIGGWGRVPFNEPYAPLLSTIYDGA